MSNPALCWGLPPYDFLNFTFPCILGKLVYILFSKHTQGSPYSGPCSSYSCHLEYLLPAPAPDSVYRLPPIVQTNSKHCFLYRDHPNSLDLLCLLCLSHHWSILFVTLLSARMKTTCSSCYCDIVLSGLPARWFFSRQYLRGIFRNRICAAPFQKVALTWGLCFWS